LSVAVSRQHHTGRRRTNRQVLGRQTTPNLRPALLIGFNQSLFRRFTLRSLPSISLTLLIKQAASITTANRQPAKVISHNRDVTALQLGQPAIHRFGQIETQMRQRNQIEVIPMGITLFGFARLGGCTITTKHQILRSKRIVNGEATQVDLVSFAMPRREREHR
jgi:hypothetical protein